MVLNRMVDPNRRTNPIIWCVAIVCAILAVIVILAGIAIFVVYMIMKPKVPYVVVRNAHLDQFDYNQMGWLNTQLTLFIRRENDNIRASVSFYDARLYLRLGGKDVAVLMVPAVKLVKNSTFEDRFVVASSAIPLKPVLRNLVDRFIKQDRIILDLEGDIKTRWNIGFLGSVKFRLNVNCPLQFRFSTHGSIGSDCISKLK